MSEPQPTGRSKSSWLFVLAAVAVTGSFILAFQPWRAWLRPTAPAPQPTSNPTRPSVTTPFPTWTTLTPTPSATPSATTAINTTSTALAPASSVTDSSLSASTSSTLTPAPVTTITPATATIPLSTTTTMITTEINQPTFTTFTTLTAATLPPTSPATGTTVPSRNPALALYGDQIKAVYQEVAPSVVGIRVEGLPDNGSIRLTQEGSGIIWDEQGTVVTYGEILSIALDRAGRVKPRFRIGVLLPGGRIENATLAGRDPLTDVCVLRLETGSYRAPKLARANEVEFGDSVLSVGYPDVYEAEGGLAVGNIVGMSWPSLLENGLPFQVIRTTARISVAYTGGALANARGEIIGLAGYTRRSVEAFNLALPASLISQIVNRLTDPNRATLSWMGVSVLDETSYAAFVRERRIPATVSGLYVADVFSGSPAFAGGLSAGDILLAFNDVPLRLPADLNSQLRATAAGMARLRIYRSTENQQKDLQVMLQEYRP